MIKEVAHHLVNALDKNSSQRKRIALVSMDPWYIENANDIATNFEGGSTPDTLEELAGE